MRMSLRVRLLGTIIGAIVLFFVISVVAARLVLQRDLVDLGKTQVTNGGGAFGGYWDSRKDQIRLLVAQDALSDALRKAVQSGNVAALQDQLSNVARTSRSEATPTFTRPRSDLCSRSGDETFITTG